MKDIHIKFVCIPYKCTWDGSWWLVALGCMVLFHIAAKLTCSCYGANDSYCYVTVWHLIGILNALPQNNNIQNSSVYVNRQIHKTNMKEDIQSTVTFSVGEHITRGNESQTSWILETALTLTENLRDKLTLHFCDACFCNGIWYIFLIADSSTSEKFSQLFLCDW